MEEEARNGCGEVEECKGGNRETRKKLEQYRPKLFGRAAYSAHTLVLSYLPVYRALASMPNGSGYSLCLSVCLSACLFLTNSCRYDVRLGHV